MKSASSWNAVNSSREGGTVQLGLFDPSCFYCGSKRAPLLCDYVIAREADPDNPRLFKGLEGELFTCDRPLCEGCATRGGTSFCCGRGGCDGDTIYFCPEHRGGEDYKSRPMTAGQASDLRSHLDAAERARIRRKTFSLVRG